MILKVLYHGMTQPEERHCPMTGEHKKKRKELMVM